jgi:serine/threonine protein kinase
MTVDPSAITAALPGNAPAVAPNEVIGKYRLDREIGAGGMGVVWAAVDPDLERPVAIKLLRHEASDELPMRTRLLREARAMARLRHPNVVTVFEVGSDKGRDYIAMELVEGGTLDDWLQTKPPRDAIVEALLAAGRGLAAAHAAGVVHRDFKPHNVLRAQDGHIYVTDFGLARGQIEEGAQPELVAFAVPVEARRRDAVLDSRLTQTGVLIGTPAYMAPEQFTGGLPDPKSDQFAWSVTAWQALTGERPFRGDSLGEIEKAVRGGAKQLVARDLPQPLRAVLDRGLDPSPEARWPDMPSLLDAFAAAARPAKPKRRWLVPVLASSVLVAGGAVTAIVIARRSTSTSVEDVCASPRDAFAKVLTPERRRALQGFKDLGALAVMEQTRAAWTRSLTRACQGERTADKQELIDCLVQAREETRATLARIDQGQRMEIGDIVGLTTGVAACDPNNAFRDGQRFDIDVPDPPEPPEAPESPPAKW